MISCDGSCFADSDQSGWGFTVSHRAATHLQDYCGPTVVEPSTLGYIGATIHSNNVGELEALIFAMSWYKHSGLSCPLLLAYDSEYAACTVQRIFNGRSHLSLVLVARHLYDQLADRVLWRKVLAHTGDALNERADLLAKLGANNIICGQADISLWADGVFRR